MRRYALKTLLAIGLLGAGFLGQARAEEQPHMLTLHLPSSTKLQVRFLKEIDSANTITGQMHQKFTENYDEVITPSNSGFKISRTLTSLVNDPSGQVGNANSQTMSNAIASIKRFEYTADSRLAPVSLDNIDEIKATLKGQADSLPDTNTGQYYNRLFSSLDATTGVQMFLRDDVPIYSVIDTPLSIDTPVPLPPQVMSLMGATFTLPGHVTLKTWDVAQNSAHFIFDFQTNPEDLKRFSLSLMDKMAGGAVGHVLSPEDKAMIAKLVSETDIQLDIHCEVDIATDTGLLRHSDCLTTNKTHVATGDKSLPNVDTSMVSRNVRDFTLMP